MKAIDRFLFAIILEICLIVCIVYGTDIYFEFQFPNWILNAVCIFASILIIRFNAKKLL